MPSITQAVGSDNLQLCDIEVQGESHLIVLYIQLKVNMVPGVIVQSCGNNVMTEVNTLEYGERKYVCSFSYNYI